MRTQSTIYLFLQFYIFQLGGGAKKQGGADGMLGEIGIVKETLNPHGRVLVHGELWKAKCEGKIMEGEHVIVESVEGLKVRVKKNPL